MTAQAVRPSDGLPYASGTILTDTEAHLRKQAEAWRHIQRRRAAGAPLHNVTGLERGLPMPDVDPWLMDDEWTGALYGDRLRELGLAHLGGTPGEHDILVTNRLTAALYAAMQVVVRPGSTVVGLSPSYSHPAVVRAVRDAGGLLADTTGLEAYERALDAHPDVSVVAVTRLAVTYEALDEADIHRAVELAHARGALVVVDDAGGARVGPAALGQPRTLRLGADLGATGLDKYGVAGPRVGLLGGRADLVARARARAYELGSECRPVLYPAVVRTLEDYTDERVRELIASTRLVGAALRERLGGELVQDTPFITRLPGEALNAELTRRAGPGAPPLEPIEATAALAMVLLRDHGLLTVHFAGLPPGTAALLVKFLPAATVAALGGPGAFAAAVDDSLDRAAAVLGEGEEAVRRLILGP
ncbi:aminotransferase class I/II-fold pyridoxal phosphate-dependent enzyme [Nonomuraea bangladeshensis]